MTYANNAIIYAIFKNKLLGTAVNKQNFIVINLSINKFWTFKHLSI